MLLNLHTHHAIDADSVRIVNLHEHFENKSSHGLYSTGLHPWYITAIDWQQNLQSLQLHSQSNNVLAIGECGLDRICSTPFRLQEQAFKAQIEWANMIAKPLIIHCVRAHRECMLLLKEMNNRMPVIFHGFNNSLDIALQLVKEGYYLSFGHSLFKPSMEPIFAAIALEHIFLETDDNKINIEEVYHQAAKIKNISTDQLSLHIQRNSIKVFNRNFI